MLIIGVHTPETKEERNADNVAKEVKRQGITYPVLIDPVGVTYPVRPDQGGENWTRWHQAIWPAVYLIDKKGQVRYGWEGELDWQGAGGEAKMAQRIEELLKEKG